jgi:hypothetical protein
MRSLHPRSPIDHLSNGSKSQFLVNSGASFYFFGVTRLQHDFNQDSISTYLFYIYFYRYNHMCLGENVMVLWNLLDGGPSHSGSLLGPSESMRGGTPGTNPHQ